MIEKSKRFRKLTKFDLLVYVLTLLILIVILYPIYFVVIASFSDPTAVASGKVWLLPQGFTFDGYMELFRHSNIWIGYRNTILYTAGGTLVGLFINLTAAFVLSRKDFMGRKFIMTLFVITMFFNGGLIPTFVTVKQVGLYDNPLVMIIPFSVSAFNVIVARTFFKSSIPEELWEQAKIDGCGNIRYFVQIVLPLSKAIISVLALWIAVGMWNSYFNALIYLKDSNYHPLQLILRNILITNNMQTALGTGEAAQIALRLSNLMRYSVIVISTIPIMCIYPLVQKHFNKGIMIGSVKG